MGEAYENCFDLPLYNFVKRVLTGDNKWLIKSGSPVNIDEAWANIYAEYIDLKKDVNSKILLDIKKELAVLDNDILIINAIVSQLKVKRNEELIEILKKEYGFRLTYEDLSKDLKRTISITKSKYVELKTKENEYQKNIAAQSTGAKEWTEEDYISQLIEISKYQGGSIIHMKDISVAEYMILLNKFKGYLRILEQQSNGGRK